MLIGNSKRLRFLILLYLLVLALVRDRVASADLISAFQEEYPKAAQKLEDAYSHVRVHAIEERTEHGKLIWTEKVEFLREGNLTLTKQDFLRSEEADTPPGTFGAYGGENRMCFHVYKRPLDKEFQFIWFGPNPQYESDARVRCLPVFGAYYVQRVRITEYLESKRVRLVAANNAILDGEDVIEVDTETDTSSLKMPDESSSHATAPDTGIVRSKLFFLPHTWALAGYTIFTGDKLPKDTGGVMQMRVQYESNSDVPKMKFIDYWLEVPAFHSTRYSAMREEISSIEFGPIPTKEFTAAAVGVTVVPFSEMPGDAPLSHLEGVTPSDQTKPRSSDSTQSDQLLKEPVTINKDLAISNPRSLWIYGTLAFVMAILGIVFQIFARRQKNAGASDMLNR